SDAATNVAGGKGDILMADSPVTAYAIARSRGTLEAIGEIEESALNGIVVAKDQPELAEAIRAALQHLIDSGHMERILAAWGNDAGLTPPPHATPPPRPRPRPPAPHTAAPRSAPAPLPGPAPASPPSSSPHSPSAWCGSW